jgi:hypothetical protein
MTAAPQTDEPREKDCPACGAEFVCGAGAGDGGECWCSRLPPLGKLTQGGDCFCPTCLREAIAREALPSG